MRYEHAGSWGQSTCAQSGHQVCSNILMHIPCMTSLLCCMIMCIYCYFYVHSAHRIRRSPYMGKQPLTVSSFKQMCGRAGRLNLDDSGEAILMIQASNTQEKKLALTLVTSPVEPLQSVLFKGEGGGLEKLLLEMICCERLVSETDLQAFIECTLLHIQHPPAQVWYTLYMCDVYIVFIYTQHMCLYVF